MDNYTFKPQDSYVDTTDYKAKIEHLVKHRQLLENVNGVENYNYFFTQNGKYVLCWNDYELYDENIEVWCYDNSEQEKFYIGYLKSRYEICDFLLHFSFINGCFTNLNYWTSQEESYWQSFITRSPNGRYKQRVINTLKYARTLKDYDNKKFIKDKEGFEMTMNDVIAYITDLEPMQSLQLSFSVVNYDTGEYSEVYSIASWESLFNLFTNILKLDKDIKKDIIQSE